MLLLGDSDEDIEAEGLSDRLALELGLIDAEGDGEPPDSLSKGVVLNCN